MGLRHRTSSGPSEDDRIPRIVTPSPQSEDTSEGKGKSGGSHLVPFGSRRTFLPWVTLREGVTENVTAEPCHLPRSPQIALCPDKANTTGNS